MTSNLTHDDVTQILRLADELPDGEMRLEKEGFSLHILKGTHGGAPAAPAQAAPAAPGPAPSPAPASRNPASEPEPAPAAASPGAEVADGFVAVRAPMLGRFFRASSPDEPSFVEIGTRVGADDTVCLIEVMKLFNTIKAGVAGTVVAIHPQNNSMVEYDQLLLTIRPD